MEKKQILSLLMCESDSSSSEDEFDGIIKNSVDLLGIDESSETVDVILNMMGQEPRESRNCLTSYIENVVPKYTEVEFRRHFRITRELFNALSTRFGKSEAYSMLREDKRLSPEKHMLVFLWFAGHEAASFRDIGDRFDLSISTVSIVIHRAIMFVSNLSPHVIKWPNDQEKKESSEHFKNLGFPNVIGAIDGTHIIIDPPSKCKDSYINRKGQSSLQVQAIANHKKKFVNIFTGFPGSTHDSRVLKKSNIYPKMSEKCGDYFILGDSAYPLMENLLTPYRDNGHLNERQKNFNKKLSSSRVIIEHSFGILKQRFRQLYYCKLSGIRKLNHFIRACCVLHNLSDEKDLVFEEISYSESSTGSQDENIVPERDSSLARIRRDEIALLLHN